MDLSKLMRNVSNVNVEEVIKTCISEVSHELNGLTRDGTCFVYSNYIFEYLRDKHVPARIINTSDFTIDYEHYFVLVLNGEDSYYLIDMTFGQFGKCDKDLEMLLSCSYQLIGESEWAKYIKTVCPNMAMGVSLSDAFHRVSFGK